MGRLLLRLFLFFSVFYFSSAEAKTYEIAEPDAIAEFEASLSKTDIKKLIPVPEVKAIKLPEAPKKRIRYIDPTYCLKDDIVIPESHTNGSVTKWRVLYPRGYCFNPIDYIPHLPPRIIVFNPCSNKQTDIVKKIGRLDDLYLFVGCLERYPFAEKRFASVLSEMSKKQLHIEYAISIIEVDPHKRRIKIEEIPPSDRTR